MKKLLSLIIALIVLTSPIVFTNSSRAAHGYLPGDADDDGDLSMKDVLVTRRYIAGLTEDKDIFFTAADIVADEDVNNKDVLKMRRIIAGLDEGEENNPDSRYKVDEVKIAGKNVSRFTIVYPESLPEGSDAYLPSTEYAARQLKKYIGDACGAVPNIAYADDVPEDEYRIVYTFDYDDELELGKEGYAIEVKDGDLIITSGTMRGAIYATFSLLEDWIGYRFFPDSMVYLYRSVTADVPEGYYDCHVPPLWYRGIGSGGVYNSFLQMKINAVDGSAIDAQKSADAKWFGGGVGTVYIHAHSFVYQMAGWENRLNPELDPIANGEQPCMTAEETYEKIIDFSYKLIDQRLGLGLIPGYHFTQITCSGNDNGNYCMCSRCKKVYDVEQSIGGAQIRLCNRVADEICGNYPDIEIFTCAYSGTNIVPKMTKPDPRVVVCFCNVGCNNHELRHPEQCDEAGGNARLLIMPERYGEPNAPSKNGFYMEWLKGWLEVTDNVYFWYYTDVYSIPVTTAPNLFNFFDDVKYLTELGVKGFYMEGSASYRAISFEGLRVYLMCKIMWDPGMTEEEYERLIDEYLRIYYGDGSEYVKEYMYMMNYAADINGCWTNNFDYVWNYYDKDYYAENYETMRGLIDGAKERADAEQRSRLENLSIHIEFLGLSANYAAWYINGDDASCEKYASRYSELWNLVLNKGVASRLRFSNFPQNANDPVDPCEWISEGFEGHH